MRILHVIQELETGGAERVVISLVRGARRAGHEVATAAAPGALHAELGGDVFPVPLVRRRPWRALLAARALRRALAVWRPDLLHCHNPGMALAASLATRRGATVPGVVTFHGIGGENYGAAARTLRFAALPVVACGPGVEQGLAERGLRAETTVVNGISPPPAPAEREALERELGVPAGRRLVVAAGRLTPLKGHALAIRALAAVPDATLLVLGEGELRGELEREARTQRVDDRVVFAGARRDARAIIGSADAVVLSSAGEGLPLVALEALAAGTPVVATAVRGVRELVVDGESALLTPPGDPQALGAALARVLGDPSLTEQLRTAGREIAARYTDEAMVARYLELYDEIVHSRRP